MSMLKGLVSIYKVYKAYTLSLKGGPRFWFKFFIFQQFSFFLQSSGHM